MSGAPVSFVIDTEVAPAYLDNLLNFIEQRYIMPRSQLFTYVLKKTVDDTKILAFTIVGPRQKGSINVEMRMGKPIQVTMVPSDETVPREALDRLREDLIILVQLFEEEVRKTTLYFAWVSGEEVIPEKSPLTHRRTPQRIFFDSMLLFFIVFFIASIFLFLFLPLIYAVIGIIVIQLLLVLNSDKLIARTGDWKVTSKRPYVHLLQYHLPVEEWKQFGEKYKKDQLVKMKKEIYDRTLAAGREIDCKTAEEVLLKYGFECMPENLSTKKVNVYELVEKAAEKFNLSVPKIVIANTMVPNAAASGPSPSHGVILITTGLLVQLEEDEIFSVVGHEFSHLRGRDPLNLFGLTMGEYILRLYLFFSLSIAIPFFLFYLYYLGIMALIFFVAKFFEARADLESAVKIGQPKVLAEALRKIGFRKLQIERAQAGRTGWIGWDPHPPISFRIARLEKLETPVKVKHLLIQSAKDVVNGFLATIR